MTVPRTIKHPPVHDNYFSFTLARESELSKSQAIGRSRDVFRFARRWFMCNIWLHFAFSALYDGHKFLNNPEKKKQKLIMRNGLSSTIWFWFIVLLFGLMQHELCRTIHATLFHHECHCLHLLSLIYVTCSTPWRKVIAISWRTSKNCRCTNLKPYFSE